MAQGDYPLPKFHFQIEWGGTVLGFTEVSGLDVETEPIEYRRCQSCVQQDKATGLNQVQ